MSVPGAPLLTWSGSGSNPDEITATSFRLRIKLGATGGKPILGFELDLDTLADANVYMGFPYYGTDPQPYQVTNLLQNTQYWFRVRARNADGWGAWSTTLTTTTLNPPSQPPPPDFVSATTSSVTLNLSNALYMGPAPYSHILRFYRDGNLVWTTSTTGSTFTNTGMLRAQAYEVTQAIKNASMEGVESARLAFSTLGSPPSAPAGYSVYDIASTTATVSTGTISDNGGAVPNGLQLVLSSMADGSGYIRTYGLWPWAPAQIDGLTKGTTYYIAEQAKNTVPGGGLGPLGPYVPFTTRNDVPSAPVLSLDSASSTTATFEWTAPTDLSGSLIGGYQIRLARDFSFTTGVQEFTTPGDALTTIIDPLLPSTTYWAMMWTDSDKGRGSSSNKISFTTTSAGGSMVPYWIKVAGVWKQVSGVWLKVGGTWKLCTETWQRVGGVWKKQ